MHIPTTRNTIQSAIRLPECAQQTIKHFMTIYGDVLTEFHVQNGKTEREDGENGEEEERLQCRAAVALCT